MMTTLDSTFSPPFYPAYVRFTDGLKVYLPGADSPQRWRWHPKDGRWYPYPIATMILEEVGLPVTATPVTYAWDTSFHQVPTFHDWDLPQVFKAVSAAYQGFAQGFPHAVWSARTGEWRAALQRTS